jgi:hypothetical protein
LSEKPIYEAKIYAGGRYLTDTNFMGYFQAESNQGDTLEIRHNEYEQISLPLPEIERFKTELTPLTSFLAYEGGMTEFYRYFQQNLKYPTQARRSGLQAQVWVEFSIDSNGASIITGIYNDPKSTFSQHIFDIFEKVPPGWSSDYESVKMVLPLVFKLEGSPPVDVPNLNFEADIYLSEIVVTGYAVTR